MAHIPCCDGGGGPWRTCCQWVASPVLVHGKHVPTYVPTYLSTDHSSDMAGRSGALLAGSEVSAPRDLFIYSRVYSAHHQLYTIIFTSLVLVLKHLVGGSSFSSR